VELQFCDTALCVNIHSTVFQLLLYSTGPTIQYSNQIALDKGLTELKRCISLAREARQAGVTVPLLFMGYYNTFRSYGTESKLISDCRDAGINGFIIVDLPPGTLGYSNTHRHTDYSYTANRAMKTLTNNMYANTLSLSSTCRILILITQRNLQHFVRSVRDIRYRMCHWLHRQPPLIDYDI
jgi:hypothetical protein